MLTLQAEGFAEWREQARRLVAAEITPLEVTWAEAVQPGLFGQHDVPAPPAGFQFTVPPGFLSLANTVSCHRDVRKWDLLYQLLFRLWAGEKHLLQIATDPLIHALHIMQKQVSRDAHKAKAFVRFRLVQDEDGGEHYIAWHRPDHRILPIVAPFFSRRFEVMRWTVLTPDQSVMWDGQQLHYGKGVNASEAPQADILEDLWRDYYRSTFNPARIKLKMMRSEMPVRHWATLPETQIIADMLSEAPARVQQMLKHTEGSLRSAADFLPAKEDIDHLRVAAKGCEGCELHNAATQTVFGVGPATARIMLVGEQPGNDEDLEGAPFIGPAGQVLDDALSRAGLRRADLYITNAVKHFRFLYKDSFRQHQSPSRYHVQACKPWLNAEIKAVQPALIVCLGNTAARALISPNFVMRDGRGVPLGEAPTLLATYHPSALLRLPERKRAEASREFEEDLALAARWMQAA